MAPSDDLAAGASVGDGEPAARVARRRGRD
jgi:hypothetical protein